jgi:TetR/AcrR family transcriptional repressor of nem operon
LAPLQRLEAYFDDRIKALRAAGFVRGCLLGNFSAEVADHSALMREHLAVHFAAWGSFFADCIAEAQQQGAISDQFPADLLGRFILNSWEGALLRMRAERSAAPLIEFKEVVFGKLLA